MAAAATVQPAGDRWSVYLFVSRTRSSLVGAARKADLPSLLAWYNCEGAAASGPLAGQQAASGNPPAAAALLRPWRHAETIEFSHSQLAREAAKRVSQASGFRARLAALEGGRDLGDHNHGGGSPAAELGDEEGMPAVLDGLTYANVDFLHPQDASTQPVTALALVDTGSSDCDLRQQYIDALQLPVAGELGYTRFETAAGRTAAFAIYDANSRIAGREARVRVSPVEEEDEEEEEGVAGKKVEEDEEDEDEEEDEKEDDVDRKFGFGSCSDDAVLGYSALTALDLLVDCRNRQLLPASPETASLPSLGFLASGMHVFVELAHPTNSGRRVTVRALVDTGSTDMDVQQRVIDALDLPVSADDGPAQFETAGGLTVEAKIHRATLHILGRSASVRVSPSEASGGRDDEDEEEEQEDEALLGHDALAALGLLVDCRGRRLLAAPDS